MEARSKEDIKGLGKDRAEERERAAGSMVENRGWRAKHAMGVGYVRAGCAAQEEHNCIRSVTGA